ncbi:MAG: rhodanese-related sulfurtransferase [Alphaproteobacteria bacterium]
MKDIVVASFYHFTRFEDPAALREPLLAQLSSHDLRGTVLLAPEGFNGTLAGSQTGVYSALEVLRALPNSMALEHKESYAETMPFYRLKVRLKKEIVTMGVSGVDPSEKVGTYVAPKGWNDLIADHETIVIDARNDFEIQVGTFEGAINPKTNRFSELPQWLEEHRAEFLNKKVAMFCTGGIRCEKATSYLKGRGVEDVFHLKGGILQYLENIPEAESRWHGECFVFDGRVSVKHDLKLGDYELCYACRSPVSATGRMSDNFVAGVSCDHCIGQRSDEQRARYAARQVQIKRAEEQGKVHIGATFKTVKKSTAFDE